MSISPVSTLPTPPTAPAAQAAQAAPPAPRDSDGDNDGSKVKPSNPGLGKVADHTA